MDTGRAHGAAVWAGLAALCFCCHLAVSVSLLPAFDSHPEWSFQGERLLTTPDGYYFMRMARDWADGRRAPDDPLRPGMRGDAPPLSVITALGSRLTGASLQTTAFFTAPVLASLAVIPMLLFGAAARSRTLACMAALSVPLCEIWFARTTIGVYDTDCLILPLWFLVLYALYRLDRDGGLRWAAAALLAALALHRWWPQAGLPFALLALGVYAASIVLPAPGQASMRRLRFARRFKAVLLLTAALFTAAAALGMSRLLPGPLGEFMGALESHLRFTLSEQQTLFTQTGWTVEELERVGLLKALGQVGAHWSVALAALAGLALLSVRHPRLGFFCGLPSLGLFCASLLLGNRFLLFSTYAVSLGLGWLCAVTLPALARGRERLGPALGWTAFAAVFIFSLYVLQRDQALAPTFKAQDITLARTVNMAAGPRAALWNWWGPGYMLQYYAGRETFFDGGNQTPENAFIAARPLAAHDPLLARNWIKFFSVHPDGLARLTRQLHSKPRAVSFLEAVFALPQDLEALVADYGLDPAFNWRGWLFPDREAYIVLLADMLLRNTWLRLGSWDPNTLESPETPFYAYDTDQVRIDRQRGLAVVGQDNELVVPYSALYRIAPTNLSHDPVREHGSVVLSVQGAPQVFMVPEYFFHALTFQLLYVYPDSMPGFRMISYNPYVGGVWRVE